jgi:hypothetical protein
MTTTRIRPAERTSLRTRLQGTKIHLAWRYAVSALGARRAAGDLRGVATYCLFIGHARSGHSIVGALLDAHPEIVISDELDALRYLDAGFSRDQLLHLSIRVARHQAARQRRKHGRSGMYSYFVPDQWQGRWDRLRVVGDSRAGWTVQRLTADPALLGRLEETMRPLTVRFIHVVRNPFDNISTMMIRGGRTLEGAVERYFDNCSALVRLRDRIGPERILTLRHEELIRDPRTQLSAACRFLGVEPGEEYLAACAGILYPEPSRSRANVPWSPEWIDRVNARAEAFDFLAGYGYES